jgi:pimeloyl-ACP methyl ester carboxylesterase
MLFKFLSVAAAFSAAQSPPTSPPQVDPLLRPYARPATLARLPDGRRIHLNCMGRGSPTVILTAGMGDWSSSWRRIQPQLARSTRVCAWDRAGFGFSSGSVQPQTAENTTSDLQAALHAANERGPYIVVGHSAGSFESLLFAIRNRRQVRGAVFVDPSIPDQDATIERAAPALAAFMEQYHDAGLQQLRSCLESRGAAPSAEGHPVPPPCFPYPSEFPPELTAELTRLDADRSRTLAFISLEVNFNASSRSLVDRLRRFGNMPLIVLSAAGEEGYLSQLPQDARNEFPAFRAAFIQGHRLIAALSTRGVHRAITNSGHYIQNEQPEAVLAAIEEVIRLARGRSAGR